MIQLRKNFNSENLSLIKRKEWYHQRFDGSPLFLSFIAFAEVRREKRKPAGTEADIRICFFDDDKAGWYLDMKDKIQDIRGLSASTGCAVGKVKIINSAKEINKVKQGDILMAVMTRPDYIAGMKEAGAIVTNEGGITSHAAIVARELGMPCIIGTKVATQVFKDGDMVEVNANHGWVRKMDR